MNEQEVIDLMESSQSAMEWDNNCDQVKEACEGYPTFWWVSIVKSGRADRIMSRWGDSTDITITAIS